ncbi:EAL domain-containing protein [Klebsiella aerogenes]
MNHIISSCQMFSLAVEKILTDINKKSCKIIIDESVDINSLSFINKEGTGNKYFIYIPDVPFYFLMALKAMYEIIKKGTEQDEYIIFTSITTHWTWKNIKSLGDGKILNLSIKIVHGTQSLKKVEEFIVSAFENNFHGTSPHNFLLSTHAGLTIRETESLIDFFSSSKNKIIKKNLEVSKKTLYNQQKYGLIKLLKGSPELVQMISGASQRWKEKMTERKPHSFEKRFILGCNRNEVYSVYQPILTPDKKIKGFEILTRWNKDGDIILPNIFLPKLENEATLLLLTSMSVKSAVNSINKCNGQYFFSVNIHPSLVGSNKLLKICDEAFLDLKSTDWKHMLILEISEKTRFNDNNKILNNLISLRSKGIRLYLDDCYSEGSVIFPVRQFSFDGYKLDKSISDNIAHNKNDQALVFALNAYCSLTGKQCIAEGVEDENTFKTLTDYGVNFFQGYLFYRPLKEEGFMSMILGG